jgi:hypothetical protein
MLGFGQAATDPWLILASRASASINPHTIRADLVRAFGPSNVVDQDGDVGEGETEPGIVVFPKDAQRSIEILWKDPDKKTKPNWATISGKRSLWHGVRGMSLGTSLSELERLNGRAFKPAGFGWDYSGTVTSWENGVLASELDGGHGRHILRLDSRTPETVDKDVAQVEGEYDFSSNHPVTQKLNPRAYQVIWEFEPPTK